MSYSSLPWSLENIDLDGIDLARVRDNEDLFLLLCSASFVESGSDLYTHNLIDHFAGDDALQAWLRDHWEHEEMQHGRALSAYVRHVWPEFDWEAGFKGFFDEYGAVCTAEELESSRGLELAARCVVETGTASLYRALNDVTDEPVLKRVNEIKSEDSDIAMRHVFDRRYPALAGNQAEFRRVTGRAQGLLKRHLPAEMTVKMLLKPLDLPARLHNALEKPLTKITERLFLH